MARSFLSRHCIPLPQEEPLEPDQLRQLGGKAAALMQLAMENLPVLPGVVLLPSAFERARPAPPPGSDAGASAQPFPHQLEATVKRELLAALDDLILRMINRPAPSSGGNTGRFQERRWAVRSSGRGEDGSVASYAGQFLSRLNVADADLEEAILAVWHSGSGAALASYRQSRGLVDDGGNARTLQVPAVLIQPMLQPRFAGVAFSADPVSGRRGVTLVQAVAGIAADLVAGRE
ncbi:MAG: PEP/pyruvate-binding domain-containing protein, partial [Cyanobium sp.]